MEVKPGSCIYVLDDVISDELCETIRTIIDNTYGYMEEYADNSNVQAKCVRICDFENKKFGDIIDNEIYKVVSNISEQILQSNHNITSIGSDSGYQLRKIYGATRKHCDSVFPGVVPKDSKYIDVHAVRKLSLIIALNDDYEGGEFCFPNHDVNVKLKKRQAIFFPPYWTHPHMVNKPENNTFRYTINTWITE
jgi:hypothetical protein